MIRTNGKKIALDQLQTELVAAGLDVSSGLGTIGDWIFPYDATGNPTTFTNEQKAQTVIANHVATRPLTNDELNIQYATAMAANPPDQATVNHVLAQAHNVIPRDRVPDGLSANRNQLI